jgi:hypothetical protein
MIKLATFLCLFLFHKHHSTTQTPQSYLVAIEPRNVLQDRNFNYHWPQVADSRSVHTNSGGVYYSLCRIVHQFFLDGFEHHILHCFSFSRPLPKHTCLVKLRSPPMWLTFNSEPRHLCFILIGFLFFLFFFFFFEHRGKHVGDEAVFLVLTLTLRNTSYWRRSGWSVGLIVLESYQRMVKFFRFLVWLALESFQRMVQKPLSVFFSFLLFFIVFFSSFMQRK